MRPQIKRLGSGLVVASLLVMGCVTPEGRLASETFGRGLANLVLAPFMIAAGLAQGLAFLPYTIGTGLTELNQALLQANAVPLDDSYKATFGVPITDPRVDPRSGEIRGQEGLYGRYRPEAIFEANRAFQRLLVSQGMPEDKARHYVLAGNYAYAWSRGHILLAVMYRHSGAQPIRVASKETGIVTTLMVLAAEAVKSGKRSTDYWEAERRWRAGETTQLIRESMGRVKLEGVTS